MLAMSLLAIAPAGCGVSLGGVVSRLQNVQNRIIAAINRIQDRDPRMIALPSDAVADGDTVVIDRKATIVTNITQDITVETLPNITLLAFENRTGFDSFVDYAVDGELQSIFVLDGESLLIDYPCLTTIDILSRDDFDPVTGDLVGSFDLSFVLLDRGSEFDCGDAVIITLDTFGVTTASEFIDLTAL